MNILRNQAILCVQALLNYIKESTAFEIENNSHQVLSPIFTNETRAGLDEIS